MEKIITKNVVWIIIITIIIIFSSILYPLIYSDNWAERGQIGDTFNIVNSISTLIACVIGVITLIFYGIQIIEQKKEIDFGANRQNEIEKNLSEIAATLKQTTINSNTNLKIQSYLNIIEMKRNQIANSKSVGLSTTAVANLQIEMNENIIKLETLLKSI